MNKTSRTKGKSFIVEIKKEDNLVIRGNEEDIKKLIKILKNKGLKIKNLEIYPCL